MQDAVMSHEGDTLAVPASYTIPATEGQADLPQQHAMT